MFGFLLKHIIDLIVHIWHGSRPGKNQRKSFCEEFIFKYDLRNKSSLETLEIIKANLDVFYENDLSCKECFEAFYLPQLEKDFSHLSKVDFEEKVYVEYYELRHKLFPHNRFR